MAVPRSIRKFAILSLFLVLSCSVVHSVYLTPEATNATDINHQEQPLIEAWSPSLNLNQLIRTDGDLEPFCEDETSSIGDFPDDLFTREQLKNGAIVLHIFAAFYFFTLLAVVCNDYFLPTIECICEDLNITPDVAAATFMAVSGAIPEFFTNMISTFITKSGMGLGAVIGTLFFNTLGVAACAGIATRKPVQLLWYPLARDCLIFGINVAMLTAMSWDGLIQWYEGLILSIGYVVYWIVLFQNTRIKNFVFKYVVDKWHCCKLRSYDLESEEPPKQQEEQTKNGELHAEPSYNTLDTTNVPLRRMSIRLTFSSMRRTAAGVAAAAATKPTGIETSTTTTPRGSISGGGGGGTGEAKEEGGLSLRIIPRVSVFGTIWWFYTWPIRAITTCLIPNPKTQRRLYPLSFIMCIAFIGFNSYLIFWMIVVIGDTFGIPEVVMGLTILCWGSCLPEAIACIIIIRQGSGGVGVSNSLGSNSMAILFSLGVPWLIRTSVDGAWTTSDSAVNIYSHGINYIIGSILFAILSLFVILSAFRYRLKKTIGLVLMLAYGVFLTLSLLLELNVIFPSDC